LVVSIAKASLELKKDIQGEKLALDVDLDKILGGPNPKDKKDKDIPLDVLDVEPWSSMRGTCVRSLNFYYADM